jgi:hypothetical protein
MTFLGVRGNTYGTGGSWTVVFGVFIPLQMDPTEKLSITQDIPLISISYHQFSAMTVDPD